MSYTDIIAMREQMATLATQARTKLNEITDKTDETRAKEIEAQFDKIMADHDAINARVERMEKLDAVERAKEEADLRSRRPHQAEAKADAEEKRKAPEYKEVFTKAMRFGAGSLDNEERSILIKARTDVPNEIRAQAAGTDSAGGYTVPEGFSGEIDKALAIWGPMLDAGFVRQYPTASGNPIPWPTLDYTSIVGELKSENSAATNDGGNDLVFGQKLLNAYLYDSEIVKVSIELLQDSAFSIEGLLTDCFGESLGRTVNTALTTGTGSSQPNGIVTASSQGKVAASTTAITSDELIDLVHSVDPAYRMSPSCRFMFNDTTMSVIRKLKDGQGNYLWQMGDIRSGQPNTILGHGYAINQAMASGAANAKTVLFGDMSRYIVRRAGNMQMLSLRERFADALQVGFISFMRVDGELLNTAAVKHLAQAAA